MQRLFHPQELVLLALEHAVHRDARPAGDDLRDVFRIDSLVDDGVLDRCLARGQFVDAFLGGGHLAVAQLGDLSIVARALGLRRLVAVVLDLLAGALQVVQDAFLFFPALHQVRAFRLQFLQAGLDLVHLQRDALALDGLLLDLQLLYLGVEDVDRLRHGVHLQAELGRSLVHEVDGLVRQEAVVDVAVRKIDCRDQRVILDAHPMVILIFLLESSEYRDALCRGGLVHHHHLETAFEGLVGLEILLVLVQCR